MPYDHETPSHTSATEDVDMVDPARDAQSQVFNGNGKREAEEPADDDRDAWDEDSYEDESSTSSEEDATRLPSPFNDESFAPPSVEPLTIRYKFKLDIPSDEDNDGLPNDLQQEDIESAIEQIWHRLRSWKKEDDAWLHVCFPHNCRRIVDGLNYVDVTFRTEEHLDLAAERLQRMSWKASVGKGTWTMHPWGDHYDYLKYETEWKTLKMVVVNRGSTRLVVH